MGAKTHMSHLLEERLNGQSECMSAMCAILSLSYPFSMLYEVEQLQQCLLRAAPSQSMC